MTSIRLPIYPVAEVIFPGQLVMLSGADQRLLEILKHSREQDVPVGLVYVTDHRGYNLARVGTTVRLVEPHDVTAAGPESVLVVGHMRFQMHQLYHDMHFLEANAQLWPWRTTPRPDQGMIEKIGAYMRRYSGALSGLLPTSLLPKALKPDLTSLGILGAVLLRISDDDKQQLLETRSADMLLRLVFEHLRLQVPIAERLAAIPPPVHNYCERTFYAN